jgi:hypothetical protein
MTSRRSIAERVIARARSRGAPVDEDVEFMAIVELWVTGEIETNGMRDRYNALLKQRSRLKRNGSTVIQSPPKTPRVTITDVADHSPDDVAV